MWSFEQKKFVFVAMTHGILPVFERNDRVATMLKDLHPDEARQIKRKFRKLWRKICKECSKDHKLHKQLTPHVKNVQRAEHSTQATPFTINQRKMLVYRYLWTKYINKQK